eukprot:TRINITY_DN43541_c0_g1_i1.p2 TRINITY_DN43541_c0_g1~~TRINITY_DN43541_c0_g1_i1.p2  ORF type:complete len:233 (-),score=57.22 TRINITY_DN43541_c0_g1_i1:168-866(-)
MAAQANLAQQLEARSKHRPPSKPMFALKLGNFQCFLSCMQKGDEVDGNEVVIADSRGKIRVRTEAVELPVGRPAWPPAPAGARVKSTNAPRGVSAASSVVSGNGGGGAQLPIRPSQDARRARVSDGRGPYPAGAADAGTNQRQRSPAPQAGKADAGSSLAPPQLPPPRAPSSRIAAAQLAVANAQAAVHDPLVDLDDKRDGNLQRNESMKETEAMRELISAMSFREDWADFS